MKNTCILTFLLFLLFQFNVTAQTWAFHINGNTAYPVNNDLKSAYPILWYSSEDDRGVLVGGFGAGVSHTRPLKGNIKLKIQLNGQRSRFYDMPSIFYDVNGAPIGAIIGINTNLNTSLFGMPVFSLSENQKWRFGAGLGLRGTFTSKSDYGETFVQGQKTSLKLKNKSLAPVHLFLPLELTKYFGEHFFASTRVEAAITKVSKLPNYKKERSAFVFAEIGYQL
ncbi:MAG: hypothetical protein AAFZ15_12530 [Bacteroidota bacterium]